MPARLKLGLDFLAIRVRLIAAGLLARAGVAALALILLTGLAGGTGQIMITQAYFEGEATAVAPVDYLRLLFAILFGYTFFQEVPTWYTLAGSAIIIGSTLYIAHRERQLRHPPPRHEQIALKTH